MVHTALVFTAARSQVNTAVANRFSEWTSWVLVAVLGGLLRRVANHGQMAQWPPGPVALGWMVHPSSAGRLRDALLAELGPGAPAPVVAVLGTGPEAAAGNGSAHGC